MEGCSDKAEHHWDEWRRGLGSFAQEQFCSGSGGQFGSRDVITIWVDARRAVRRVSSHRRRHLPRRSRGLCILCGKRDGRTTWWVLERAEVMD